MRHKKLRRKKWIGLIFILPWLIGLLVLQIYPFFASLAYSFTDYNIMSSPTFVGLKNYSTLFQKDPDFWNSLKVTLIYTVWTVPGKLIVALLVALVMNKNMKGVNLIMQTITNLQSFTSSLVITNGGPLKSTYVLGLKLYQEAFQNYRMGYACAVSWVIFILIFIVTAVLFRFSSVFVYYEDNVE